MSYGPERNFSGFVFSAPHDRSQPRKKDDTSLSLGELRALSPGLIESRVSISNKPF